LARKSKGQKRCKMRAAKEQLKLPRKGRVVQNVKGGTPTLQRPSSRHLQEKKRGTCTFKKLKEGGRTPSKRRKEKGGRRVLGKSKRFYQQSMWGIAKGHTWGEESARRSKKRGD